MTSSTLKFYNAIVKKIKFAKNDGVPIEVLRLQQSDVNVEFAIKLIKEVSTTSSSSNSNSNSNSSNNNTNNLNHNRNSNRNSNSKRSSNDSNCNNTAVTATGGIKTLIVEGYRCNRRIFMKHQCDKIINVIVDQLLKKQDKDKDRDKVDGQQRLRLEELYFKKCDISRNGIMALTSAMVRKKRKKTRSRTSSTGSTGSGLFFPPTAEGSPLTPTASTEDISQPPSANELCSLQILAFEQITGKGDDTSFSISALATVLKDEYCTLQELRIVSTNVGPSLLRCGTTPESVIACASASTSTRSRAGSRTRSLSITASSTGTTSNSSTSLNNNSTSKGSPIGSTSSIPAGSTSSSTSNSLIATPTMVPWVLDFSIALQLNKSLRRLVLEGVNMDDNDCLVIIDAIAQTRNTTLTEISLASNFISDIGAIAIAESIIGTGQPTLCQCQPQCQRKSLHSSTTSSTLSSTVLVASSKTTASSSTVKYNNRITKLQLQNNNIRNTGAIAIANALTYNSTVRYIDLLSNRNITVDGGGVQAMSEMLKTNTTITTIGLDGWYTSRIATKYLLDAFFYNDTVKSLLLDRSLTHGHTGVNLRQLSIRSFFLANTINTTEDEKDLIASVIIANRAGIRIAPGKTERRRNMFQFLLTTWVQESNYPNYII
jgi:Leucine Rich repeat